MTDLIAYRGEQVSLAAMSRDYLQLFMEHANDLSVTRGILMRPPITLEMEQEWFDSLHKRSATDNIFAILLNTEDGKHRYIGHTGLHHMSWPNGTATTGSIIIDKTLHGAGYGTEAKLLLLYHAFYVKGLRKVSSEVKAFNGNSYGHLVKCGYQCIGCRKAHDFDEGTYVDNFLFEVFKEDFGPLWARYQETKKLPVLTDEQRKHILEVIT